MPLNSNALYIRGRISYNHNDFATAMIKKIRRKYVVLSETTGRSFGSYKTLAEAKKRLRQVEFFKSRNFRDRRGR